MPEISPETGVPWKLSEFVQYVRAHGLPAPPPGDVHAVAALQALDQIARYARDIEWGIASFIHAARAAALKQDGELEPGDWVVEMTTYPARLDYRCAGQVVCGKPDEDGFTIVALDGRLTSFRNASFHLLKKGTAADRKRVAGVAGQLVYQGG